MACSDSMVPFHRSLRLSHQVIVSCPQVHYSASFFLVCIVLETTRAYSCYSSCFPDSSIYRNSTNNASDLATGSFGCCSRPSSVAWVIDTRRRRWARTQASYLCQRRQIHLRCTGLLLRGLWLIIYRAMTSRRTMEARWNWALSKVKGTWEGL